MSMLLVLVVVSGTTDVVVVVVPCRWSVEDRILGSDHGEVRCWCFWVVRS